MSLFISKSDVILFAFTFIYSIVEIFHPGFNIRILGLGRGSWLLNAKLHVLDKNCDETQGKTMLNLSIISELWFLVIIYFVLLYIYDFICIIEN